MSDLQVPSVVNALKIVSGVQVVNVDKPHIRSRANNHLAGMSVVKLVSH